LIRFLGSTPKRTAISTDSSNFAEATTFINAAASFKEYNLFLSIFEAASFVFLSILPCLS
jgi:hypothetical protein